MAGLDIDRLIALLPQDDPTGTRHIGPADVEAIEQATAAFKSQDFAQGSGLYRNAAVAQLRATLPLLRTQVTTEVRPRLLVATAHLALQAGYMSFDSNRHDAARRLWTIGLGVAREADHPQGADLGVYTLYDLAQQAVHLGRPREALSLVHLGHITAVSSHPVSAATTTSLAGIQARAHATQGDARGHDRALLLADLAGAHAIAGDADTAVSVGHQAVDAVTAVHSPRAYDRLRVLDTALEPLHTSTGVAELRDRLAVTTV